MKTAHVLLFVILATACGTIPVSDPGPTEPAATQLPEHDAPDEPISISQTLRCGPQAVPYDLSQAPQLPTDLALESLCEDARPVIDGVEESQPRQVVRWNEDERFLEITDGGLGLVGMEVEFTLAQDGSVVEIHSFGASGFYVSSYGSTRYRLNEDEELDWKFAASRPSIDTPEDEWTVLVKEQTWDDGRLLSRVERAGEDGPISRNFEWQYDDRDRLVSAEAIDHSTAEFERAFSAEYGYDSEDRLTQLTRFVSGVEVEHQTWEWEGDRLTARTYRSPGLAELAETHGGESWEWAYPGGLDTYERRPTDWTSNPWSSAVPIERGDCEMLPQGPGHGYPAAEIEYDLTWSMDQRPSGIGFAYGNDSYGWNYGDLAWFGHAGLGSSWLGAPMLRGDFEVLARVEYDDEGRMIREFAETRGPTGSLGSERTRTFEASGLAADHVIFRFEEEVTERTLLFERDALGELTRRVLLEGDDPLAEQRWTRDSTGRIVGVEVDPHSGLQPTVFDAFGQPSGFGTMEAPGGSWQWAYDEVDRVVRRSGGEFEQTLAYDDEGRLIEVTGTFDNSIWPMRHEYDDAGRLTEECTPHGTDDWYCRHHVLDDAGRPHATFARNGAGQEWLLESWTDYRCVGR